MGINSTEVSYNFGQLGSVYTKHSQAAITPPTGKVFVAITMLEATTFDDTGGLVAVNDGRAGVEFIGTDVAAHDTALSPDLGESGVGGLVVDDQSFPEGVTIFGRWNEIDIKGISGAVIAYIGD